MLDERALAGVRGAPLVGQDAHDDGAEWAERAGLDGGAAAAAARAGHSGADLAAAATFASSAVRDLARIAGELDPVAAADGRVLAERLDPKLFPIMAELAANATFDDHEGNIALMVWFGLHRC